MKKIYFLLLIIHIGCFPFFQKTNGPTHGLIFTQTKFPGEFNQNNDVSPTKKAEGCSHQALFILMWGDSGAGSIALANKIKRIATIDHSTLSFMGLYSNYCTIIRGE